MTALLKPQCCARVNGHGYMSSQCSKTGKIERDGKHYCGTHDPVAVKAKQQARADKYNAEWAARRAVIDANLNKQIELERRAECFDDLLAALEDMWSITVAPAQLLTRKPKRVPQSKKLTECQNEPAIRQRALHRHENDASRRCCV